MPLERFPASHDILYSPFDLIPSVNTLTFFPAASKTLMIKLVVLGRENLITVCELNGLG